MSLPALTIIASSRAASVLSTNGNSIASINIPQTRHEATTALAAIMARHSGIINVELQDGQQDLINKGLRADLVNQIDNLSNIQKLEHLVNKCETMRIDVGGFNNSETLEDLRSRIEASLRDSSNTVSSHPEASSIEHG